MCAVNRDDVSDESDLSSVYSCSDCHDSGIELCDLPVSSCHSSPAVDTELHNDAGIAPVK